MKNSFACSVALVALLAAGSVSAGPAFDIGDGLDLSDIEPVDMDIVRQADGTVMTRESFTQPDGSVVTRTTIREPALRSAAPVASVELTPSQRRLIWHTIAVPARADAGNLPPEVSDAAPPVREHIEAAPGMRTYRIGSHMTVPTALQPLPETLTVAVPSVQDHLYTVVDDRVLLIDPATNSVVAEVAR